MHKVALSCNAKPEIAQNTYLSVYINLYLNVYLTSDNLFLPNEANGEIARIILPFAKPLAVDLTPITVNCDTLKLCSVKNARRMIWRQ